MWEHLSVLATEGREMLDYCRQQVANFDAREAEIRADIDRQRWPDFLSNQIERL
jgi:acetolactate synthase regulatory subunit